MRADLPSTLSPVDSGATPLSDPEYRALVRLADEIQSGPKPRTPLDRLQQIVDVARELTAAKYAAMAITDENDRTEGFITSGLTREQLRGLKVPPQAHGPLGTLRQDGRPVRYDDVRDARNAFGFPPRHPEMISMLGVPVWSRGEVRGSLYVTDRNGSEPFRDEDEQILLVLARYASMVVENEWY